MGRKGRHLNTLEKYHIYKISRSNLHMDDTHNETHNPIFKIIQYFTINSSAHAT
jgi:hypothetical protein